MLSDMDVGKVIAALPETSFLRRYVWWGVECTDAPAAFHLGVGLSLLAAVAPSQLTIREGAKAHANIFTMLVGVSASSRKTTALGMGLRLLYDVAPDRVLPEPESTAALVEGLAASTDGVASIWHGEMGAWWKKTHQSSAYGNLRESYMTSWDCLPLTKSRARETAIVVEDPRLTVVGAVAPGYLTDFTDRSTWEDGLLSRFVVLVGVRDRLDVEMKAHDKQREWLVWKLKSLVDKPLIYHCSGLEPSAAENTWIPFLQGVDKPDPETPDWVQSIKGRIPSIAAKVALLIAFDLGMAEKEGWLLDSTSLELGLAISAMHMTSVRWMMERVQVSTWAQKRAQVLQAIGKNPRDLATLMDLTRNRFSDKQMFEILNSLMAQKAIYGGWTMGGESAWSTEAPPLAPGLHMILGGLAT